MRANFNPSALRGILLLEGKSETDIAADHGGLTGYSGITDTEFQLYLKHSGQISRDISTMTPIDAAAIMAGNYWSPGYCDALPTGLDFCHFQWCVNHGAHGAGFILQKALGVMVDGDIGPQTLDAISLIKDPIAVCKVYLQLQEDWYATDVEKDPSQREFLHGWENRTVRTMDIINGRPLSV